MNSMADALLSAGVVTEDKYKRVQIQKKKEEGMIKYYEREISEGKKILAKLDRDARQFMDIGGILPPEIMKTRRDLENKIMDTQRKLQLIKGKK